ncbi:MAG TPA: DUF3570 domain-containing protein [Steroidobacteraceae bacterium]|nr:DUF3570 domain-containing protein [Steroidobacteraceae bacterium]
MKKSRAQRSAAEVRRQLMAASCALLGASAAQSQDAADAQKEDSVLNRILQGVSFDSALAYYREDGRIQAIEPVVNVSKTFRDGEVATLNATFDSLSGASPNGALPSNVPQTFASPSGTSLTTGRHLYTTAPGRLPADPNYKDDRIAVAGNWQLPVSRLTRLSLGGKISGEDDFISTTLSASIAQDFNERNTTLLLGVDDEFDSLRPIGGAPVPDSDYSAFAKNGSKTKNGIGVLLGLTQVMTRQWLSELNLSWDRFHGYLNDPYKITSLLDSAGNTLGYMYESRPDERTRKSAYLENRVAWDKVSAGLALRYMQDDWGIHSETAQAHVHFSFANRQRYLEPSIRWYRQTAADFYTPWLAGEKSFTANQASDSRLGAFHAFTYGVKYAQKLSNDTGLAGSEFSVRLEYYQQIQDHRLAAPPLLQNLDLYPGLKAILLQFGWRF